MVSAQPSTLHGVLEAHVERGDAGVRDRSFDTMAAAFVPDGVMRFEEVPA